MPRLMSAILLAVAGFAPLSAQDNTNRTLWSGTVGQRQVVVSERWTPPFTDVQVSVRVSGGGRTSTIELSNAGTSPDVVVPSGANRLVVISGGMASIVDLDLALVVDQFLVARPSVSPTGSHLAFQRSQQPGSRDEDVLLLYDVGSTARLNRVPASGGGMDAMRDAGIPVFPEWHAANRRYRGRHDTPGSPIETLRSPIVWSTDTAFVFLTGRGSPADPDGSLAIHHVQVRGSAEPPVIRSQTVDAKKLIDQPGLLRARAITLVDCGGSSCQALIEWAPAEGLRAPSLSVSF